MEKNETLKISEKFQHAFASVCEDQIQQLIEESRKEALAQAKQILRINALNNVLEAVVGEPAAQEVFSDDEVIVPSVAHKASVEKKASSENKASIEKTVEKRSVQAGVSVKPVEAKTLELKTVVKETIIPDAVVETPVIQKRNASEQESVRVKAPVRHRVQQMPAPTPKNLNNAPPVLNDRILEEIEAIREQIRRNELLLSQIKPFVQTSKVQEK